MSTNKKHLCMNCMSDMGPYEVCMMCGWADGSEARELYHLQPRTILAERYEVGLALFIVPGICSWIPRSPSRSFIRAGW